MQTIILKRVGYGKDKTPLEDREYSMGPGYPVGTVRELKEYFKNFPDVKKILCYDKTGKEIEQTIKL